MDLNLSVLALLYRSIFALNKTLPPLVPSFVTISRGCSRTWVTLATSSILCNSSTAVMLARRGAILSTTCRRERIVTAKALTCRCHEGLSQGCRDVSTVSDGTYKGAVRAVAQWWTPLFDRTWRLWMCRYKMTASYGAQLYSHVHTQSVMLYKREDRLSGVQRTHTAAKLERNFRFRQKLFRTPLVKLAVHYCT